MKIAAVFISLAFLCNYSFAGPSVCQSYSDELIVMLQVDQAVRERATGAAWLLAQHSEPEAQRGFLTFLEIAVKAGEASPSDLAYLTDRIASRDGRPQLYGTQLIQKTPCEFEFEPLDDRVKVNARRKAIRMPSLDDYEKMFREYLSTKDCPAK